ncbi:hypothetical protein HNY73_012729 [Argiope bruennichi]|uniref:Uncharacterized protein n=1 Tax=Argiope bruennichi TaxID=94029 RepID=A0A8T0EVU8_ARGBR|nr:hypothetical protein HNY73_012729 [Argiope bruennichi]
MKNIIHSRSGYLSATSSPSRDRAPLLTLNLVRLLRAITQFHCANSSGVSNDRCGRLLKAPPMSNLHPTDPLSDPVPPLSHQLPSRDFLGIAEIIVRFLLRQPPSKTR